MGGFSKDPQVRARQEKALAEGRELARQRRKAGLPFKRTEAAAGEPGKSRVRKGSYAAGDAGTARRRAAGGAGKAGPAAGKPGSSAGKPGKSSRRQPGTPASGDGLSRLERGYGKLLGRL